MIAVGSRQQVSQAVGPGSSLCRAKYFMISLTFVKNSFPMVPMAQCVGQQGSEAVGPGWSLCRAKYFNDFTDICQKFQCLPWHSG